MKNSTQDDRSEDYQKKFDEIELQLREIELERMRFVLKAEKIEQARRNLEVLVNWLTKIDHVNRTEPTKSPINQTVYKRLEKYMDVMDKVLE